jgi:hypothetical protein
MTGGVTVLDLAQALLSEEIGRVRGERWSGVLALSQGEVTKGLYFVDGDIAFAASTVEEDRLGANLFRIGKITETEFRAALRAAEAPGRQLGQALIEAGVLTPLELAAAVTGQVERIVFSVLRWTSGQLRRETMDRPIPADCVLDLNTNRLLLLGMRQFPDAERLERALGPPDRRFRRIAPPPFDYDRLPPSPPERAVLALCTREVTLADLLALPHRRSRLVRSIYALLAGGLLEGLVPAAPHVVARPPEPRPAPSPARPAPVQAEPPAAPLVPRDPQEAERMARHFLEKGQRSRGVEVLREVLERHPDALACRRLLAMTLAQEGGFEPAVERLFLTLLEKQPGDAELRYRLATYYRRAGMAARAILQLRLVLSADSGHAGAWRDLGELEAGEGRRGR